MLIPKESKQLVHVSRSTSTMESDNTETSDTNGDCNPPENVQRISITLEPERTILNGPVNGEVKAPSSTKTMNILQNIVIKNEDLQTSIKRELDEDPSHHHRIKITRRDVAESNIHRTPIKLEIVEVRTEPSESINNVAMDTEAANESTSEVHTCVRCNMIFMDVKPYLIHLKECIKVDRNYAMEQAHTSSSNGSTNTNCNGMTNNNMLMGQVPRLIESIRNTPCLYNTDLEGYNNVDLKEQMWSRIAVDCNFTSGKIAKGVWKKLQQEFCDSFNKRQSGSAVQPYRYEQQMQFILPFVENVNTNIHNENYRNIYPSHTNFTAPPISGEIIEDAEDVQLPVASPVKRRRVSTPFAMRQQARDPPLLPPPSSLQPSTSSARALDWFFMSMCESAKGLPFNMQLQLKKKIFDAVFEAEEIANRSSHIRTEPFSPPQTPTDNQFEY